MIKGHVLWADDQSTWQRQSAAHRGVVISCGDVQELFMSFNLADHAVNVTLAVACIADPMALVSKPVVSL